MTSSRELAQQFIDHFNARDRDALLQIVAPDLRYNGRKEDGMQLLLEWIDRATTTMTPRRWFGHEDLAVAEIDVIWYSARSGEIADSAVWAIAFAFADNTISAVFRYADAGEAITKMGLLVDDTLPDAGISLHNG